MAGINDFSLDAKVNPYNQYVNTGGMDGAGQTAGTTQGGQFDLSNVNGLADLITRYDEAIAPMAESAYYPDANRGVQVGTGTTKTLGTDPIFSSGGGLFPYAVMDARNQAKALAREKEREATLSAMDFEIAKIDDNVRQKNWGDNQLTMFNEAVQPYLQKYGAKGYAIFKASNDYKSLMNTINSATSNFNSAWGAAKSVLDKQAEGYYVPSDVMQEAQKTLRLYSNNDGTVSVDELYKFNPNVFQKFEKLQTVSQPYITALNSRVESYITDMSKQYGTNIRKVLTTTTGKGVDIADKKILDDIKLEANRIRNSSYYSLLPEAQRPKLEDIEGVIKSQLIRNVTQAIDKVEIDNIEQRTDEEIRKNAAINKPKPITLQNSTVNITDAQSGKKYANVPMNSTQLIGKDGKPFTVPYVDLNGNAISIQPIVYATSNSQTPKTFKDTYGDTYLTYRTVTINPIDGKEVPSEETHIVSGLAARKIIAGIQSQNLLGDITNDIKGESKVVEKPFGEAQNVPANVKYTTEGGGELDDL